jgi:uncharacterized membrane protein
VTSIIDRIGRETRYMIDQEYPPKDRAPEPIVGTIPKRPPDQIIRAKKNGVILEIDVKALISHIRGKNTIIVMAPAVGDFIPTGGRLLEVYRDRDGSAEIDTEALLSTVQVDAERSITQDVPFGFRLLVDIAERSLSKGINDPSTATQVIDQLHDLLRQLGTRPFPTGWHCENRTPRLFVTQPTWETLVALAFEEIRYYGSDSIQIARRLRCVLLNLLDELPEDRHAPLVRQMHLLDEVIDRSSMLKAEKSAARHPDPQGIGSGVGFDTY